MNWEGLPTGRRGRQPGYSDCAIQTCLTLKVLFGFALRQTTGFVESLLRLAGLAWSVPDFSTLSRRQKSVTVDIPYRGSEGPLRLLIDSTGIKVEGEGEWHRRKHGGSKRRIWRKLHIGIDEGSMEIRAVEMTGNEIGDTPVLPVLLGQIPDEEDIASVTADGAYDTRTSMKPLPNVVLGLSFRRGKTQSPGAPHDRGPSPEMKLCGLAGISDGLSGDGGAVTIDEAASRRRCTASSSWDNV